MKFSVFALLLFGVLVLFSAFKTNMYQKINEKYSVAYPEYVCDKLSSIVNESSGLIWYDNSFWTNNDSGGESCIYRINEVNGNITEQLCVPIIKNYDWEDMAENDDYIFIGDFGNNNGNRKNLCIYLITKNEIADRNNHKIIPEIISFTFEDQLDLKKSYHKTSFDCEAIFCVDDTLFLFTKDWVNNMTSMYYLPAKPGTYIAKKLDWFNVDGLITGADINIERNEVVLIGYKDYKSFIWFFSNFVGHSFLNGDAERFNLYEFNNVQTESVCYRDSSIYFTCEKSGIPPSLFKFKRE